MQAADYIYTASGFPLDPLHPDFTGIAPQRLLNDIAVQTARQMRFGNTVDYSVAAHQTALSTYAQQVVPRGATPYHAHSVACWCHVHDFAEGLLGGDLCRPWTRNIYVGDEHGDYVPYGEFERDVWLRALGSRLSLPWPIPDEVWSLDDAMMRIEAANLLEESHPIRIALPPRPDDVPFASLFMIRTGQSRPDIDWLQQWDQLLAPSDSWLKTQPPNTKGL